MPSRASKHVCCNPAVDWELRLASVRSVCVLAYATLLTQGSLLCRACAGVEALRQYDGPTCFAIPGNHDWIDGLETFQRHIQHKGWLGGYLLPQVPAPPLLKRLPLT